MAEGRPWHTQVHRDSFAFNQGVPADVDTRLIVDIRSFGMVQPREDNRVKFEPDLLDRFVASHDASAFEALMLGLTNIRQLPPETRAAWRVLFEHYVFGATPDVTAHIPEARRGMLGTLSPGDAAKLRQALAAGMGTKR